MKINCPRQSILSAVEAASTALGKSPKEVLRCVKLDANSDEDVSVFGTDLDSGVRIQIAGVQVQQPGSCLIPAGRFIEWVKASPDGDLTLSVDKTIWLRLGRGKAELPVYPVDEYPDSIGNQVSRSEFDVPMDQFARCFGRASAAAEDRADTSFMLAGVCLDTTTKRPCLSGADGNVLSAASFDANPVGTIRAILPTKTLKLCRGIATGSELLSVVLSDNVGIFRTERGEVFVRQIQGKYPDQASLIRTLEKECKTRIELPTTAFLAVVEQAAVMTDDNSSRLEFHFRPGCVSISSRGEGVAGDVDFDLPDYAGPEIRVAWNPDYLRDFLRLAAATHQTVRLEINDGKRPALLKAGDDWTYLIAPLTLTTGRATNSGGLR